MSLSSGQVVTTHPFSSILELENFRSHGFDSSYRGGNFGGWVEQVIMELVDLSKSMEKPKVKYWTTIQNPNHQ